MRTGFFLLLLFAILAGAAGMPARAEDSERVLTAADLLAMAGPALTELPLGDQHYTLDAPRQGYIYLCRVPPLGGGAQFDGPWIHGDSWSPGEKPSVRGENYWRQAQFSMMVSGDQRRFTGNGLPVHVPTGDFPIAADDPAARYDRNPNQIRAQDYQEVLPLSPTYSDTPFCMGMEVGVMLNGVPLNNGFDAGLRDAAAHEVQDKCDGHPQKDGLYHYHSLSQCLPDIGVKTVLGYALDGFPITGPAVAPGRFLSTRDLDVCHGITSEIVQDGKRTVTYHYVLTQDFPYSVGCFRARPVRVGPQHQQGGEDAGRMPDGPMQNAPRQPPQQAIQVCVDQGEGSGCAFTSPRGDKVSGICRMPPGLGILACVPQGR